MSLSKTNTFNGLFPFTSYIGVGMLFWFSSKSGCTCAVESVDTVLLIALDADEPSLFSLRIFLTFANPVIISADIALYINATPTGPNPNADGPSASMRLAPFQVLITASLIASAFAALLFSPIMD